MAGVRVDPEEVSEVMQASEYRVMTLFGTCTVVAMRMPCGYVLVESSACVNPEDYDEETGEFSEPRGIDKLPFFAEDTMCGFYWRGFYLIQTHDGLYLCHTGDETARAYLYGEVE